MKQLILLLGITACLPAVAAVNETGKSVEDFPDFMPKEFVSDNGPYLYIEQWVESQGVTEFTIFGDGFNEVGKFSTPAYPEVSCEYTQSYALDGPVGITVGATFNENVWTGMSKEDFATMCSNEGFSTVENHDNETWYLSEHEYFYFAYDIYGKRYPQRLYVWENTTNKGILRLNEYSYESWGHTGQYGKPESKSECVKPRPGYLTPYDGIADLNDFKLSQTLFNTDTNFEWIVPIVEAVDCSYTNINEKVEGKRPLMSGFRVESQNGSIVATVKYPAGLYGEHGFWGHLYIINGKSYLIVKLFDISNTDAYYIIYEVDASGSSVKAVGAPRRVAVSPTMPSRGTDVVITLDNAAEAGCKIMVTSVSGQNVMSRYVEPGQTSTTIDTSGFEEGMYIVSVYDGSTTHENTKIIVR